MTSTRRYLSGLNKELSERKGNFSVLYWFQLFLGLTNETLMRYVDLYNQNALTENARIAMEVIDNID